MVDAKPAALDEEGEGEGEELLSGDALDIDGLLMRADVSGLLTLARAYRSGAAPGGRDMKRCYEAYRAAAGLGSADAEYAVALFSMSGGVVPQDLKEGATHLRAAAEKGSVPAKVYLGNLYELGIHYKADPEKADVWYRNAARGARVAGEPGTDQYAHALADLGCVRYVLALVESGTVQGEEKARLLQRARAHGYGLRLKDETATERPTFIDALQRAEATAPAVSPTTPAPRESSPTIEADASSQRQRTITTPETKAAKTAANNKTDRGDKSESPNSSTPSRVAMGLAAFGYALLFAAAGVGAGYAVTLGARELVAHGRQLPGVGTQTSLVFPIVLAVVGVLPTCLVYRLETVIKALVVGGAIGGVGWVAWGTGQGVLHTQRLVQALAFGLAGFLAGLLVLGLLGGTKRQPPHTRRRRTP